MFHSKRGAIATVAIALSLALLGYSQVVIQPAKGGGGGVSFSNPYSNFGTLVYSTNGLPCLTGSVPYTQWSGIASPTGQGTRLFTAAAGWIYMLSRVELGTGFTSSSGTVTNLSVALGSTANPVGFMGNYQILPASATPYNEGAGGTGLAAGSATLDVFLQMAVTNATPGNLNTLTAGALTVTVCGIKP